jgi:hypothetical protein
VAFGPTRVTGVPARLSGEAKTPQGPDQVNALLFVTGANAYLFISSTFPQNSIPLMTLPDSNFLVVREVEGQPFQDSSPMSIALTGNLLSAAISSSHIRVFNFATRESVDLTRPTCPNGSVVLCASISPDLAHVVTGHSDDFGGEIVIWPMSRSDPWQISLPSGVRKVCFGVSPTEVIFTDLAGAIFSAEIPTRQPRFFRKQVSIPVTQRRDMEHPVNAMAVYHGKSSASLLFVSTQGGTFGLRLKTGGLEVEWSDALVSLCFAFHAGETPILARGVGHDVLLSDFGGVGQRRFEFSETPSTISVINPDTVLVLFGASCEMRRMKAGGEIESFAKTVQRGQSLADNDSIFIMKQEGTLFQLTLASVRDRIANYVEDRKWEDAFALISAPADVDNLFQLLDEYARSPECEPHLLFATLSRLHVTGYLVQGMISGNTQALLEAFVDAGITDWLLDMSFIGKIFDTIKDDARLTKFLTSVEINMAWQHEFLLLALDRGLYDVVVHYIRTYRCDSYAQLLIAFFMEKWDEVHQTVHGFLAGPPIPQGLFQDTLRIFERFSLTGFIDSDPPHAERVLGTMLDVMLKDGRSVDLLLTSIVRSIGPESSLWPGIVVLIKQYGLNINGAALPNVEGFIFFRPPPIKAEQVELLQFLLEHGQIQPSDECLDLVRSCGLRDCERTIIRLMKSPQEFLQYLITYRVTSFRDEMRSVLPDSDVLKSFIVNNAQLLFTLNPGEFVDELWLLGDMSVVHRIADVFQSDISLSWHFFRRIFQNLNFRQVATDREMVTVLTLLSRFRPTEVMALAQELTRVPVLEVLPICKEFGIVDATLYLCELSKDMDTAREFGFRALEYHLFEGTALPICEQIFTFLKGKRDNQADLWLHFLGAFALPLFAALEDNSKLQTVIATLRIFLRGMVADVESAKTVAQGFSQSLAFLPFRLARPLIIDIFRAIREKNEFSGALAEVVRSEAVSAQLSRVGSLAAGVVCEALKCGKCGRMLGEGSAVAAPCGHVFHEKCAADRCCPKCASSFQAPLPRRSTAPQPSTDDDHPPAPSPKSLQPPAIGKGLKMFKTSG